MIGKKTKGRSQLDGPSMLIRATKINHEMSDDGTRVVLFWMCSEKNIGEFIGRN